METRQRHGPPALTFKRILNKYAYENTHHWTLRELKTSSCCDGTDSIQGHNRICLVDLCNIPSYSHSQPYGLQANAECLAKCFIPTCCLFFAWSHSALVYCKAWCFLESTKNKHALLCLYWVFKFPPQLWTVFLSFTFKVNTVLTWYLSMIH